MIYCTECGTLNPEGTKVCIKCNTMLPVLNNVPSVTVETSLSESNTVSHTDQPSLPSDIMSTPTSTPGAIRSTATVASSGSTIASWWQRLGPDWKATLIFWVGFLVLLTVNNITGGAGNLVTAPFTIAFALGQGVLVGRLASKDSRYTKADYFRLGLFSGLWTILIDLVLFVVIVVVLFGITLGTVLAALPVLLVSSLANFAFTITLTSIGGWLYGRYGGKKLIAALVGTGCGFMVIIGILLAIVIAVLATNGIKLFGG
jgi:hypothetical protein